jgi:hypothetical protein
MDVIHEAEQADWFGAEFVARARMVASLFDVPVEWLLAAISWETGGYESYHGPDKVSPTSGLHWSVNASDKGGGLFGFPHLAARADRDWTPVQQLESVRGYIQDWMGKLKIDSFPSPTDFYVLVRGPYGLMKDNYDNDEYDMGAGLSLGDVRRIYWDHVNKLYGWTPDNFPGKGPDTGLVGEVWNARIGSWYGRIGFDSIGSVWYAAVPQRSAGSAEPEIDLSSRTYGHWHSEGDRVKWRFQPTSDIRRFEVALPLVNPRVTTVSVSPAGQGSFKMWRGAEPA